MLLKIFLRSNLNWTTINPTCQHIKAGKLYCLDAGYGEYRFLDKIIQQPSSFVMRLRDNASYETIEERTLSEADRKIGIEFDRVVWLGTKQKSNNFSKPMRIIQLHYYDERALLGHKRKSQDQKQQ